MKQKYLILTLLLLITFSISACSPSSSQETNIGLVTEDKDDEEAIKEVISAYFQAIKNYDWETYNMNEGLEFWTERGQKDLIEDPNKLTSLEKSIKDNKISRELQEFEITTVNIDGEKAIVKAFTIEKGTSNNERFVGSVQSDESIELTKIRDYWRISDRNAQIVIVQHE